MKKMYYKYAGFFFLVSMLGLTTVACSDDDEKTIANLQLSANELVINRFGWDIEGKVTSLEVNSNVYWTLRIEQNQQPRVADIDDDEPVVEDWLSVFPLGGTGELTLSVEALKNEGEARTATLILETLDGTTARIQVIQNGSDELVYYLNETMGDTPATEVDVNFYEEWNKLGVGTIFTRYAGFHGALVDNSNASQGYEEASGGNNILFPDAAEFTAGMVETRGFEFFTIQFGVFAPEVFNDKDLKLYISKNGEDWVSLAYTFTGSTGWGLASAAFKVADIDGVYFKWVATKANYRLDDIKIVEDTQKTGEEVIFQTVIDDGMPAGYVYYQDDFSWITVETFGGTAANFPTNELTYVSAHITPEQREVIDFYGWTQQLGATYLRPDIMKLGRTNVGGDLISPVFSNIDQFKSINVDLTFDVSMYASAGGTKDLDGITIEVLGTGTINSQALTSYSMEVGVWSNTGTELTAPMRTVTFKIFGATNRTQFRVKSGIENSEQVQKSKSNRFFIDNVKVTKSYND